MLNDTKDGIICDYCGAEHKGDFVYYSFDFKRNVVMNKFRKEYELALSADVCESCMRLFTERLDDVSKIIVESEKRCDVTGEDMGIEDHEYYRCYVSKVVVDMNSQPYECTKCGKNRGINDGPCQDCDESSQLIRKADVNVDDSFVVLNFSQSIFDKFKSHIETLRKAGAEAWAQ